MSRWTLEQWLGLRKLREDWNETWPWWGSSSIGGRKGFGLAKDGAGHLLIGLVVGLFPAYAGAPAPLVMLAAAMVGLGRETWQFLSDSSPNPNLVDRCKDMLEISLGGLLVGLVL